MVDELRGRVEHVGLKTTRVRSTSGEEIGKLARIPVIIRETAAAILRKSA